MNATLLALLALAAFQETPAPPKEAKKDEAAELLKNVEETWAKAKSIRYKATVDVESRGKTVQFETEGRFKEGKVSFTFEGDVGGKPMQMKVLCDGSKVHADFGRGEPKIVDMPKDFAANLKRGVARAASFAPSLLRKIDDLDPKDLFTIHDLKLGKPEKIGDRDAKVLTYQLEAAGEKEQLSVTLWLDAKTHAIIKRQLESGRDVMTETFSEITLEAELKDDDFVLPKQ